MGKQPYIPFYIGDYIKDTRVLPLSVRGAWVDLILFMWDNPVRGEISGTIEEFSRIMSCDPKEAEFALNLLKAKKTADIEISPNGIWKIVSRRMKKDFLISSARSKIGSKGGKNSRFTSQKKLYNEPGYLYIMADDDSPQEFKIGISKNPEKRIYGVRRDTGRQRLRIVWTLKVSDMGETEDFVLREIKSKMDGEWGTFKNQKEAIDLVSFASSKSKAKTKQNPEYESEYEIDIENKLKGAFDEIYIEQQSIKWPHIDFDFEYNSFCEKVRGSPDHYANHDSQGIRLAFQAQLRNAKHKKINGNGTYTDKRQANLIDLATSFAKDVSAANSKKPI